MIQTWIVDTSVAVLGPTLAIGMGIFLALVACFVFVTGCIFGVPEIPGWFKWLRNRSPFRWVEPFPGDSYIMDGRRVDLVACDSDGVTVAANGAQITVSRRYFHHRARRAEDVPVALSEMRGTRDAG